jgi:hypothetical protein
MARADTVGTAPQSGAAMLVDSATLTNYIIESCTDGARPIDYEDVFNEDGVRVARLIFNRNAQIVMTLICKTSATPLTDFPEGDMCAHSGLTDYFVTSAKITSVKGARKIAVTLDKILTNA